MKNVAVLLAGGSLAVAATGATFAATQLGSASVKADAKSTDSSGSVMTGGLSQPQPAAAAPKGKADKLTFEVAASISNLTPGVYRELPVLVTNPVSNKKVTLTVVTLDVSVGNANATCTSDNLEVGRYDANATGAALYELAPGETKTLPLDITLVDSLIKNQSSCRGATFPLTIRGTAAGTK